MDEVEQFIKNGDQSFQKEKYIDAIREYTKAYEIIGKNEDAETAELCYKLSQAYYALDSKNTENSKKYGEESLNIHKKLDETELQVLDLINLGYIDMDAHNLQASRENLDKAVEKSNSSEDPSLLSLSLIAKAELLSRHKAGKKEAMETYEQVMQISGDSNDWDNYFEALRGKLSLLRDDGKENIAFQIAMDSLDLIDKLAATIKNKKDRKSFRKSLSYIYDVASDISMELENVDQAIKIAQRLEQE